MSSNLHSGENSSGPSLWSILLFSLLIFTWLVLLDNQYQNASYHENGYMSSIRGDQTPRQETLDAGLYENTSNQEKIRVVGQKLIRSSIITSLPTSLSFHILSAPEVANAFVLPNGQIYITTGMMDNLITEGELAGILSHEMGHLVSAQAGIQPNLPRFDLKNEFFSTGSSPVVTEEQLFTLEISRANELKADYFGLCILYQSGYDPLVMKKVMQVLATINVDDLDLPEYLSTHPDHENRAFHIENHLAGLESCDK